MTTDVVQDELIDSFLTARSFAEQASKGYTKAENALRDHWRQRGFDLETVNHLLVAMHKTGIGVKVMKT